jgi:hypothetical protein
LCLFLGIAVLLGSKAIPQGGPLQRGRIMREVGRKFWNRPEWRMWVTDDAGETVCAIKFSGEQP